jgi:type II secretory ATPase GspE/PulE/Tfp pilus assembly ATPase PilB-like protein
MVGEIRDEDTAGLAVNTALTGHLLLSTLHTNDAATTLPRLFDMKIEPYLVASTVNVAMGQRLIRKICEKCKKAHTLTESEVKSLSFSGVTLPAGKKFFKGTGCEDCNNTGYDGRIGIHEVMLMDNDLRQAILKKESADVIKKIAIKNGMITMIEDGFNKAAQGITTIEEVLRVMHE